MTVARLAALALAAMLANCGGGSDCTTTMRELPAPEPGQAQPVLTECR
jgi:hypothetical protein